MKHLVNSVAAVALVGVLGAVFGTPYVLRQTFCGPAVMGGFPGEPPCRPPLSCTYTGIQGRRSAGVTTKACPTIVFFGWEAALAEPVVPAPVAPPSRKHPVPRLPPKGLKYGPAGPFDPHRVRTDAASRSG